MKSIIVGLLMLLIIVKNAAAVEKQVTITGTISSGTAMSNIVTSNDSSYNFESESKAGNAIFKVCKDGDDCIITGMVEDGEYIRSVSSVKKVAKAIVTIQPANNADKATTDKDIKKSQPCEVVGTIMHGHNAAGGNFWVDGGKKKQYTLRYVWELDESVQTLLSNLADSRKKVLVKGTLNIWKDGNASFDDKQPISIYKK